LEGEIEPEMGIVGVVDFEGGGFDLFQMGFLRTSSFLLESSMVSFERTNKARSKLRKGGMRKRTLVPLD
jgi:hypothetical protein